MRKRYALFFLCFLFLWPLVGVAQESTVPEISFLEKMKAQKQSSRDTYFSGVLGMGSRNFSIPEYNLQLNFVDDSPIPDTYEQDFDLSPQDRVRTLDWGIEWGKFDFWHFEMLGSRSFGEVKSSAFALGVGMNKPFLQHRLVLRGVLGFNWARYHFLAEDFPLNPTSTNATINETQFFSTMDVRMQRRVLELKPRVEALVRLPFGSFLKASGGFVLPTVGGKGTLVFSGTGIGGESRVSSKVKLSDENVNFSTVNEGGEINTFPKISGAGLFFSLGLGMNFSGLKYYR